MLAFPRSQVALGPTYKDLKKAQAQAASQQSTDSRTPLQQHNKNMSYDTISIASSDISEEKERAYAEYAKKQGIRSKVSQLANSESLTKDKLSSTSH